MCIVFDGCFWALEIEHLLYTTRVCAAQLEVGLAFEENVRELPKLISLLPLLPQPVVARGHVMRFGNLRRHYQRALRDSSDLLPRAIDDLDVVRLECRLRLLLQNAEALPTKQGDALPNSLCRQLRGRRQRRWRLQRPRRR